MVISNKEGIEIVKKLKEFCENKACNLCCFADDIDGHCMLTDDSPNKVNIKTFIKQAEELIED